MNFFSLITGGVVNNGTLVTDVLFSLCAVVLFGRFELRLSVLAQRAFEAAVLFVVACSLDVAAHALGLSGYPAPSFGPLFVTLLGYGLLQGHLSMSDRLSRAATFMALFVLTISITRTIVPAVITLKTVSYGYSIPSAFSYVAMAASTLYVRRFSIEHFDYVSRPYLLLILAQDAVGALSGWVFFRLHDAYDIFDAIPTSSSFLVSLSQDVSMTNLVVCVGMMLLVLVGYLMFYMLSREHDERAELLVTKKGELDSESMARVTRDSYERLREVRHEIKNHDAYLAALLEAGDYERLRAAFERQTSARAEVLRYVSCGNPLVDAVVNSKMALARSQGVELTCALAVPAELPFEEGDIFRLLANLLDNAIEGTLQSASPTGPVELKIVPTTGYYLVVTTNPCEPKRVRRNREGRLVTSKDDRDIHGFGTKVIAHIAEKYQGTARFSVEGETFTASVMLAQGETPGQAAPAVPAEEEVPPAEAGAEE